MNFSTSSKIPFEWPIPLKNIRLYASWADSVCKLAPSTIKTYISALSKLHLLSGLEMSSFLSDPWLKIFLKGAENAQVYDRRFPAKKISFSILQLLGHAIARSGWSHYSKLLFWSASLFLFFGSFRLSEVFPLSSSAFDESTDLTWHDIIFRSDGSISIHIKSPKTGGFPGQYVDLFSFSQNNKFCPVNYLNKLLSFQQENFSFPYKRPPFLFSTGVFLTASVFRQTVISLLSPFNVFPSTAAQNLAFAQASLVLCLLNKMQIFNLMFKPGVAGLAMHLMSISGLAQTRNGKFLIRFPKF